MPEKPLFPEQFLRHQFSTLVEEDVVETGLRPFPSRELREKERQRIQTGEIDQSGLIETVLRGMEGYKPGVKVKPEQKIGYFLQRLDYLVDTQNPVRRERNLALLSL